MTNKEGGQFPRVYWKCPRCGCEETVCRKAWQEEVNEGHVSQELKDLSVALERTATPLTDPKRGMVLSVRLLITSYDVCWECGLRYAVRVEKQVAPVQFQPGHGQQGRMPPFNIDGLMGRG